MRTMLFEQFKAIMESSTEVNADGYSLTQKTPGYTYFGYDKSVDVLAVTNTSNALYPVYSGAVWKNEKVISFDIYPTITFLDIILDELKRKKIIEDSAELKIDCFVSTSNGKIMGVLDSGVYFTEDVWLVRQYHRYHMDELVASGKAVKRVIPIDKFKSTPKETLILADFMPEFMEIVYLNIPNFHNATPPQKEMIKKNAIASGYTNFTEFLLDMHKKEREKLARKKSDKND